MMSKYLLKYIKSRLVGVIVGCMVPFITFAQTDTLLGVCGSNADFFAMGGVDTAGNIIYPPYNFHIPSGSGHSLTGYAPLVNCHGGKIDLFFEDINSATGKGFDDGTIPTGSSISIGEMRVLTFCKVIDSIQQTFDFSGLSGGNILIYVAQSLAPGTSLTAGAGDAWYARATPFFDTASGTAGVTGGWVNEYVTNGIDHTTSAMPYHGFVQVNFDQLVFPSSTAGIPWQNYYIDSMSCNVDLYSVLLHEMGHAMGFMSFVVFSGPTGGGASCGGCVYGSTLPTYTTIGPSSGHSIALFTRLDTALCSSPGFTPTSLQHLITYSGATPVISSTTYPANNNYWLNNLGAPENYPIFSGGKDNVGSFLSHTDSREFSYSFRERISPGDRQDNAMGPSTTIAQQRRLFSKGEMSAFVRTLGYTYIGPSAYIFSNHPPYSTKMAGMSINDTTYAEFTESASIIDYTITNDVGASPLTIDITTGPFSGDLSDMDSDPFYIDTATIVNLRGCGDLGASNHGRLSWTGASPTTIIYTPRENFYGIAQLGFNVTDGYESGSYRVVTIKVNKGTNVGYAIHGNSNMICNPNFEAGSEIRTVGAGENISNSYIYSRSSLEGKWQGVSFSDSHPYCFRANKGAANRMGSGIAVKNSDFCGGTGKKLAISGNGYMSFPVSPFSVSLERPLDTLGGHRYQVFSGSGSSYYYLDSELVTCTRYKLSFDLFKPRTACITCTGLTPTIAFTDSIGTFDYTVPSHTFSFTDTGKWVHDSLFFYYCGIDSANILYIGDATSGEYILDNLSLVPVSSPSISVTITNTVTCTNNLAASVTEGGCTPVYSWLPTTGLSCSSCASPTTNPTVTTIYTLTVTDACGTRPTMATVTVNPVTAPITGSGTVCAGGTRLLSNAISGGVWTCPNIFIATIGSATGVVTGVAAGITTVTYTYPNSCYVTATVTVIVSPAAITGASSVCAGSTITLSSSPGGIWTTGSTGIASVGSNTGVVTGIAAGTETITYTVPATSCYVTKTISVNPLAAPITGSVPFCVGTNITMANTVPGGTWSSGGPSVATIGSSTGLLSGISAGTAIISYTLSSGCTGAAVTVTVIATPSAITGTRTVCEGVTTVLSSTPSGGTWTSSDVFVATVGSASGIVSGILNGNATITYTLGPGCYATADVTVNSSPASITGTLSVCVGATTTLSDATSGGEWSSSDISKATIGSTSGIVTGIDAGTPTITYTLGNGCFSTASLTVNTTPSTITGTTNVCVGLTRTLASSPGGGVWGSSDLSVATITSSTSVYTGIAAGTATITYTVGAGCYVTTGITVNPLPSTITGTLSVCVGASTALSSSPSGGIWTRSPVGVATIGSTTGIVTGTGVLGGTATVTYTISTGCRATTVVTVHPNPAAITGTFSICAMTTTTLSNSTLGGVWTSSIPSVATIGSSDGLVSGISSGTTTITYTLPTGCYTTAVVTINPNPSAITGTNNVCVGLTTTLTTTPSGGSWTSSNPSVGSVAAGVVTGIASGSVNITYTLATGCYATYGVTVNPNPSAIIGLSTVCIGGSTTDLNNATGGGSWSSGSTGIATVGSTGSVTAVSTGITIITYTMGTGCIATHMITVISAPAAITGTMTVCEGSTTALSDATTGGSWSSGSTSTATVGTTTGIVTGVAAGVATISYGFGGSCYSTATITVNPLPTSYSVVGGGAYCAGGTGVHVGVSGSQTGVSYQLYLGGSPVGSPITGTGTAVDFGLRTTAGTYTVVAVHGTTACTSTMSGSTVISINPLPDPISGVAVVCVGSTTTLADATPGGTWSSGATTTATVGSASGVVTGISAGTVNITYTVTTTGCYTIRVVTVNPLPPAITGIMYVCESSLTTLTDATGGGTWSSSDPIVASIGSATGIVTGGIVGGTSGTAIITYTLSTGCRTTATVTVYSLTDDCSPCHHFGDAFSMMSPAIGSSPGSGLYYINTDVTITDAVTFPHSVIFVAPGKHIYVNDTSLLTVSGTHLFSCSGMWEGITLQTGSTSGTTTTGRLVLDTSESGHHSLIEDATTAVRIENPVTPSGGGAYFLTCEKTTFNRNIIGISIKRYNDTAGTYPFRIRNTVFTSRDISAHWIGYPFRWPKTWSSTASDTAFKHDYMPTDTFFSPPFLIDNPNAMGTGNNFPGVACKSGALPTIGIRLDSVGTYTPSGTSHFSIPIPSNYSEIKIGDETTTTRNQYQNLFDNLRYGIHATNANFTCVNNAFANIFSYTGDITFGGDPGGYGIFALASTSLNRLRVHSGAGSAYTNKFYGFRVAVGCNNYFNFTGKNTYMINKNTGVSSGSMTNFDGEAGYKLKTAKYSNIDISYDTVTNVQTGVLFWISVDPGGYTSGGAFYPTQLIGACNIDHNRIQAHPTWGGPLTTELINQGIVVQNIISGGASGPISMSRTVGDLNVSGNMIHNAYNGIFVNNYWPQKGFATYTSVNNIHLRSNPSVNYKLQYGINHTQNRSGRIHSNLVHGLINASGNDNIRAFYASSWNTGMEITCNVEDSVGRGFEFHLTNPCRWYDNDMYYNLKGMVLNGGWIGPQTSPAHPVMNNHWYGSWGGSNVQTHIHLAAATASPFYVNNTTDKNPTVHSGVPLSNRYSMVFPVSIYTTTATSVSCVRITTAPDDQVDLFNQIAQQHVGYVHSTVSSYWMGQYALWKSILADSTITDSSAVAAQFAHMADSMSRYKYLTEMESLLAAGDFDSVTVMLGYDIDSMANTAYHSTLGVDVADGLSANFIVQNYQQFYGLYIKYATNNLSGSDSLDILALAELCPQIDGGVVHQARALYSEVFNNLRIFDDDSCLDVDSTYMAGKQPDNNNHGHLTDKEQTYTVFPNPNDGDFIVRQYIADTGMTTITIYDAVGRKVYAKEHVFLNSKCNIELELYSPGLYLFELIDSRKQIFRSKFVITR